jgi:hypothetical protein
MSNERWGRAVFVIAMTIVVLSSDVLADELTVQDLYTDCNSKESFDTAFCLGYIGGVGQTLAMVAEVAETAAGYYGSNDVRTAFARMGICKNTTIGAYKQAFINWAERHPEQWDSPIGLGVALALREVWPCSSEPTR